MISINIDRRILFIVLFVSFAVFGCSREQPNKGVKNVVVTTSWLECCVKDIAGDDIKVSRLCPPGSCPGHFDLKPGVFSDLSNSKILFRFHFQNSLDNKLSSFAENGLLIASVTAPEGLCIPSNYFKCCEMVYSNLVKAYPEEQDKFTVSLKAAENRLHDLEQKILNRVQEAGLKETRIVSSGHQSYFCKWLGLDTVASYSGSESTSPVEMERLLESGRKAGVKYVIANLQEGRQIGEALAHHLDAILVTFSNFPDMGDSQSSFDALVEDNIECLLTAKQ